MRVRGGWDIVIVEYGVGYYFASIGTQTCSQPISPCRLSVAQANAKFQRCHDQKPTPQPQHAGFTGCYLRRAQHFATSATFVLTQLASRGALVLALTRAIAQSDLS